MNNMTRNNTQPQNSTTTRRRPWLRLIPTLLTSLSGIILAVLSLTLNSQSPRVVIAFSARVSQSHQEYKALISIDFSTHKPLLPDNKILLP
jgi:hypothetical protein